MENAGLAMGPQAGQKPARMGWMDVNVRSRRFLLGGLSAVALAPHVVDARPRRHPKAAPAGEGAAAMAAPAGSPAATPIGPVDTIARWACIVDFNTGATLLEKAADERMPPSSLTKMMTAYIVFGMLKAGRLSLEQSLPVSEKAWRMQGSKMFVPLGQSIAVSELIEGMLIQSGNDACIVLAEGIAGSEEQFVALMNDEAPKIGLTGSHFENCTGWPADNHYMTARDVANLAVHIIRDYPQYYHFFSATDYTFNKIHQGNRNVLVDKGLADGLKTGHTDAGGFGLCASSDRGGNRIVMAINGTASSNDRAHEGERLLAWAFANFENATLFKAGAVVDHAPVWMGTQARVPLVATRDITLTLPHGWQNRSHIGVDFQSPVIAPVRAGQVLGQLVLSNPGMQDIRLDLVAGTSVEKLGIVGRSLTRLGFPQAKPS
ncbi:D-alanyl-D-alanine carboxypeptidase [Tanticharoenia sakaeratensis NBRC 103193]|uniref:serine-type D-Ala-D-Ala carboxypeptidase n=2 Tax=Tanticharoenia TaxID=444052 RepID=A0A0D6MMP9_9PROT|nr:D-alanyl-D-alanine carboxypeptidase [Tanticharoenia sakaeratensis NBRC 103193]GBQ22543.1 D-alanyl-D-alanine carboxypeptidase [Tanticharoenia sakaeratensis NBRC 103193]